MNVRDLLPKLSGPRSIGRLIVLTLVFLAARCCFAQDNYTRIELGAEFSTIRQTPVGGGGENFPGFGGRLDWNFSRRLALEGQVDFFPEHSAPLFLTDRKSTRLNSSHLRISYA